MKNTIKKQTEIILNKLFNSSFIIFNLFVLLIAFIFVILFHLPDLASTMANCQYQYNAGYTLGYNNLTQYCLNWWLDYEAIFAIFLVVFGFLNVLRFNRLNNTKIIYLIIIQLSFLLSWIPFDFSISMSRSDFNSMVFSFIINLLIAFSFYYILNKKIHILLKFLLFSVISTIIYYAGFYIGIVLGIITFGI
jgi:hypothetical protein